MFFADVRDAATRRAALLVQAENLFDFLQRKTQRLSFLDELDSAESVTLIKAIICGGAVWLGQQADPLIIVKRLHADSGALGQFTSFQKRFCNHWLSYS